MSYFDVTSWAHLAEVCSEYLKKGRGVRVVGRLKQDRWNDPEGNGRSKVYVVAEHVEFKPERKKEDVPAKEAETEEAKAIYKRRKELVEPAFGRLKEQMGLRRFLLRGLDNVRAEWTMLATAFNLRALYRSWRHGGLPRSGTVSLSPSTAPFRTAASLLNQLLHPHQFLPAWVSHLA